MKSMLFWVTKAPVIAIVCTIGAFIPAYAQNVNYMRELKNPEEARAALRAQMQERFLRIVSEVGTTTGSTAMLFRKFQDEAKFNNLEWGKDITGYQDTKLGAAKNIEDFRRLLYLEAARKTYLDMDVKADVNKDNEPSRAKWDIKDIEKRFTTIKWLAKEGGFSTAEFKEISATEPKFTSEDDLDKQLQSLYLIAARAKVAAARNRNNLLQGQDPVNGALAEAMKLAVKAGRKPGAPETEITEEEKAKALSALGAPTQRLYEQLQVTRGGSIVTSGTLGPSATGPQNVRIMESNEYSNASATPVPPVTKNVSMQDYIQKSFNPGTFGNVTVPSGPEQDRVALSNAYTWKNPTVPTDPQFQLRNELLNRLPSGVQCDEGSRWQVTSGASAPHLGCISADGSGMLKGPMVSFDSDEKGQQQPSSITTLGQDGNISEVRNIYDGKIDNTEPIFSRQPISDSSIPVIPQPANPGTGTPSSGSTGSSGLGGLPLSGRRPILPILNPIGYTETHAACKQPSLQKFFSEYDAKKKEFTVKREDTMPGLKPGVPRKTITPQGTMSEDSIRKAQAKPDSMPSWMTWVVQPTSKEGVYKNESSSDAVKKEFGTESRLTTGDTPEFRSCKGTRDWYKVRDAKKSTLGADKNELLVCLDKPGKALTKNVFGSYIRIHKDAEGKTLYREEGELDLASGIPRYREIYKAGSKTPAIKQSMVMFAGAANIVVNTTVNLCTDPEKLHKVIKEANGKIVVTMTRTPASGPTTTVTASVNKPTVSVGTTSGTASKPPATGKK